MTRRSYRFEGVATALSSISHGGEHSGTTQFMRRERFVQADGRSIEEVPVISGNALRGIWRDASGQLLWEELGRPELSLPVFHAIFSGGALAKAGSAHVMANVKLRTLRELVPHVALFGAAGGGRIIEGKMQVGKLVPIVDETAHLIPAAVRGSAAEHPSVWDVVQIEQFTRTDDAKRVSYAPMLAGPRQLAEQSALALAEPPEGEEKAPAQQMRYGFETLPAGTRFWFWAALMDVSPLEFDWFLCTLASWSAAGGVVGGRSSTGHGRISIQTAQWGVSGPSLSVGGVPASTPGDTLRDHVSSHRGEILEALEWLA